MKEKKIVNYNPFRKITDMIIKLTPPESEARKDLNNSLQHIWSVLDMIESSTKNKRKLAKRKI